MNCFTVTRNFKYLVQIKTRCCTAEAKFWEDNVPYLMEKQRLFAWPVTRLTQNRQRKHNGEKQEHPKETQREQQIPTYCSNLADVSHTNHQPNHSLISHSNIKCSRINYIRSKAVGEAVCELTHPPPCRSSVNFIIQNVKSIRSVMRSVQKKADLSL